MTARTRLRVHTALMWAGFALMVVAALGEWLGWWRDVGIVGGVLGLILSLAFGFSSATDPVAEMLRRLGVSRARGDVDVPRVNGSRPDGGADRTV